MRRAITTYSALVGLLQTVLLLLLGVLSRLVLPDAYNALLQGHMELLHPFARFVCATAPWAFLVPFLLLCILLVCAARRASDAVLLHLFGGMSLAFIAVVFVILAGAAMPLFVCYSILS